MLAATLLVLAAGATVVALILAQSAGAVHLGILGVLSTYR